MNRMAKLLWTLRVAVVISVIFIAMKPVYVKPEMAASGRWAMMVDVSRSMNVADPVKRIDAAKQLAGKFLERRGNLDVFSFGDTANAKPPQELSALEARGPRTDLAGAIRGIMPGDRHRAGIVISDGRQVGPGDPVFEAAAAGKPLLCIGVGNKGLHKDLSVQKIYKPPFAFKNIPTTISASIAASGFAGKKINVQLKEGGRVVGIQSVTVAGPTADTGVSFSWTPTTLGSKVLSINVGEYPGEMSVLNNKKEITLDVGRDRFRVLYICGKPSTEYAFLRHQFKSDPGVELVTFVILRNANNIVSVPEHELSLIPFPTQDVLVNQMATFDLVVFDEFSYQQYGLLPGIMQAIRRRVEEGGSFLLMGTAETLGPGSGYAIPEIKEMIPVDVGAASIRNLPGPLRMNVETPAHPVLKLEENIDRNIELWGQLPALKDVALLPPVRPGATALGTVSVAGVAHPVLSGWKFGKGRVAVLASRTTWRWAMMGEGHLGGAFAYQQFWKNMVLWLTRAEDYKTVRVAVEGKSMRVEEEGVVQAWVYDEYFKPLAQSDIRLVITGPDGNKHALTPHQQTGGVFQATFKPGKTGTYRLDAWAFRRGKLYGEDSARFRVIEGQMEDENLTPDFQLLRDVAKASGGKYFNADDISPSTLSEFNQAISTKFGQKILLWNSPVIFSLVVVLLIVEWTLRKRRGLP